MLDKLNEDNIDKTNQGAISRPVIQEKKQLMKSI
jgi:hypothetical protein